LWTSREVCAQTSQGLRFTWKTRLHPVSGREAGKSTYLNQINVSKPFVVNISQKREDLRLHIMV
jgi:hypothetical protein